MTKHHIGKGFKIMQTDHTLNLTTLEFQDTI